MSVISINQTNLQNEGLYFNQPVLAAFHEIYAHYFSSKPARSCAAVKDLPKDGACEIEAIAVK